MKWFTRQWREGDMTDDDFEAASQSYRANFRALSVEFPVLVQLDLHDGILIGANKIGEDLTVEFVTGDLQQGYFGTSVIYADASISSEGYAKLSLPRTMEIEANEFERTPTGNLIHRFVMRELGPSDITEEVVISCSGLSFNSVSRASRGV